MKKKLMFTLMLMGCLCLCIGCGKKEKEQEQDAENSSTNKTASSDTLHHGGTSCRHGAISLRWSRNDEIQLAAALFIFYDTMI